MSGRPELICGDALSALAKMPTGSVDLVLVDLPYGTTACAWDAVIPLAPMWEALRRLARARSTPMVFTAQQPFTTALAASNLGSLRYGLVWEKPNGTNPFQARSMPMKAHEDVLVFADAAGGVYNPQMTEGAPYKWNSRRSGGTAGGIRQSRSTPIDNKGTRYPKSVLRFAQERGLHPTQKPVALMEWLVRTYSNEGATVLDFTMGSGTTGVACARSNRQFIGVERDRRYFAAARARVVAAYKGES
jgi:site-specific DNA-methyltransferase (adenine-specific)